MKRVSITAILTALIVFTGVAAGPGHIKAVITAPRQAAAANSSVSKQLEHISRSSGENARRAAQAVRRMIIKSGRPHGFGIPHGGDRLNDKRNDSLRTKLMAPDFPILPKTPVFPKPKTFGESLDNRIAADYRNIMSNVMSGKYDNKPLLLLRFADYGKRHSDEDFAFVCLDRLTTDQLSPSILHYISKRYPSLSECLPEMSKAVAIYAYAKMLTAKSLGNDCDSARMQNGDTLLMVTDQFNPVMNPLVRLSCFYDPAKEIERYKQAADSITVNYSLWTPEFKDLFARDFLSALMSAGEYRTALDYFGRQPLIQFTDSLADFNIDLAVCAVGAASESLLTKYLQRANALDTVAVQEYRQSEYDNAVEQLMDDPSLVDKMADRLLEYADTPSATANALSSDLISRYWGNSDSTWEYEDESTYTPKQRAARKAIIYLLDKGSATDSGRSPADSEYCHMLFKAMAISSNPSRLEEAKTLLKNLNDRLADTDKPELVNMRCLSFLYLSYLEAHGLDTPKKGLKMLKNNIRMLSAPGVDDYTRSLWYEYMSALATSLGKTRDAAGYLNMKPQE